MNQKVRILSAIAVNFKDELDIHSEEKVRQKIEAECVSSLISSGADVVIGNVHAGQYKGELQVALKDYPNDGSQNIVAKLNPENHILLDFMKPWHSFLFTEV